MVRAEQNREVLLATLSQKLLGALEMPGNKSRSDFIAELLDQERASKYPEMDTKTFNAYKDAVIKLVALKHLPMRSLGITPRIEDEYRSRFIIQAARINGVTQPRIRGLNAVVKAKNAAWQEKCHTDLKEREWNSMAPSPITHQGKVPHRRPQYS